MKRWLPLAALALVLAFAWCTDDASFTFRTVENFVDGFGPRYNRDERVMVYTHPLWFLLLSAGVAARLEPYFWAIALSAALTYATFVWLDEPGALLLLGSFTFLTFQTSGLENALTNALLVLLARAVRRGQTRTQLVLVGLLALNRLDQLPLVAPIALMCGERRVRVWLACFAPLIAWEIFAFLYYGFPLPNTAYAKLWPLHGELWRGLVYCWDFVAAEPLPVLAALALAARAAWRRDRTAQLFGAGAVLQLAYVVTVGGDFMRGRFLDPVLVALVIAGAHELRLPRLGWALCAALLAYGLVRAIDLPERTGAGGIAGRWIENEWQHYRDAGWLWSQPLRIVRHPEPDDPARQMTFAVLFPDASEHYPPNTKWIMRKWGFISDAFTARIPRFDPDSNVGHIIKHVPREYLALEKAATVPSYHRIDRAALQRAYEAQRGRPWSDPQLERMFFTICSITRDPIFSRRRLRSLWRWYTGAWRTAAPPVEAQRPYW